LLHFASKKRCVKKGKESTKTMKKRRKNTKKIVPKKTYSSFKRKRKICPHNKEHCCNQKFRGKKNKNRVFTLISDNMLNRTEIIRIRKATKEEDAEGKDLIIIHESCGEIPLQIKSSIGYALKNQFKFPQIPIVVVNNGMSDKEIIEQIIQSIIFWIEKVIKLPTQNCY
jgi:hypothetical protein